MSIEKEYASAMAKLIAAELAEVRPQKRVYTLQEAATYLGCSDEQVRFLEASGALRSVKFDRYKRFDVRDIDLFIEREKR